MEPIPRPLDQLLTPPEILWATGKLLGPDELQLVVSIDNRPTFPRHIEQQIQESWQSKPGRRNGQLLGLVRVDTTPEGLPILVTKLTDYRDHTGTNLHQPVFESLQHQEHLLANGLVTCSIISTRDRCLVLGIRPKGIPGVIGGTINTDELRPMTYGYHLFMHTEDEIQEELGLSDEDMDISPTRLLGIVQNQNNLRPLLVFVTQSQLSSADIASRFQTYGDRSEHSDLLLVPDTRSGLEAFLASHPDPKSTTMATLDALQLYHRFILPAAQPR